MDYDLYPLELVKFTSITNKPWQIGYICELTTESEYKSYSMITCGI